MTVFDQVVLIGFCVLVAGFLSGMETGVVSIQRIQLEHLVRRGDPQATILQGFLEDSDRLFGTTLVGTNLCIVAVSVLTSSLLARRLGEWAELAATAMDAIVLLAFAEYWPKAWFHARPLERSRTFAKALRFCEILFRPIAMGMVGITRLFVPDRVKGFGPTRPMLTKEDITFLVDEGERTGVFSSSRRAMIRNVLELASRTARDIMTPRQRMVVACADTPVSQFLQLARETGFTRIPITDSETGQFLGVAHAFFVAAEATESSDKPIARFARKPLFLPENLPADKILPRMRRSRQPLCLVVNDHNEVTGLVTADDVMRRIVGSP